MKDIILAIDQGTTGSTAVLLDAKLQVVASANEEFPQRYPEPGWVEHAPEAIWASVSTAVRKALALAGAGAERIAAVGITNQRETVLGWDRRTGAPIGNAIVWQCRRTTERCRELKAAGHEDMVRERTGLMLDPYFSATKIAWLLDNVPGARTRADKGELLFGTIDSWLTWKLSGGAVHVTDISNASRTLLMDLNTGAWDDELLALFHVPKSILPEIRGNSEVYATTKGLDMLPDGIPIAGMAGDQQAALFGQACYEVGEAKCTFGTGAFLLMNIGDKVRLSDNGLLTTAAWSIGGKTTYALEGSAFIAGAMVQFLRDNMQFFSDSSEVEALAASVPDSGGVVVVPALTGLGAPHWNPDARGLIWGLTRGSTRAHIARAALEGIAFQNHDILRAMEEDLGHELKILRVDGGASANNLLMQFQCDLLGCPLGRPPVLETTALGAGLLAGLAIGFFSSTDEIRSTWREERRFEPSLDEVERSKHLARWTAGLKRA